MGTSLYPNIIAKYLLSKITCSQMQMLTPRMEDLPHKKFFGEAYISGVLPCEQRSLLYLDKKWLILASIPIARWTFAYCNKIIYCHQINRYTNCDLYQFVYEPQTIATGPVGSHQVRGEADKTWSNKLTRASLSAKQLVKAPVTQAVTTFDKLLRAFESQQKHRPS